MYEDPNYLKWNRGLAESQDYLYRSNPLVAWVQNAGHRAIRALTAGTRDALTLDMACGDGAHRPYMWRPDRVVGIDIHQASLEKYLSRYPDALVLRGDCYRLPFRDAVFDRVLNIYNFEHLIHLDFALEEAHRVLKAGGELLASVPTEGGLAWVLGRRLTTARRHTSERLDYLRANAIDHCNTVWQIEKAIATTAGADDDLPAHRACERGDFGTERVGMVGRCRHGRTQRCVHGATPHSLLP